MRIFRRVFGKTRDSKDDVAINRLPSPRPSPIGWEREKKLLSHRRLSSFLLSLVVLVLGQVAFERHLHRCQSLLRRGVLAVLNRNRAGRISKANQILSLGMVGALCFGAVGHGQQGLIVQNFKFNPGAYYPPPHQKQVKSLLTGEKAEEKAGLLLITGGKFETFFEIGTREMLVEAPSCVYEKSGNQSLHSPGPLRVIGSDEKFSIFGEGFSWQTNSSLFISNQVRTTIRPELLQSSNSNSSISRTNPAQPANTG